MPTACIFCQIVAGNAPAQIFYRDDQVIAFKDIHPLTPVHLLVATTQHIASLNDTGQDTAALLGRMVAVARQLAIEQGVHQSGYRLMINTGADAGQSVFHLHLHLIGGRHMPFRFG
jgi:histidine triad (HIT) family protein